MIKSVAITFLLFIALQLQAQNQSLFLKPSWSAVWNSEKKSDKKETHPGWYDQWFEMKKDLNGNIHRLPYYEIMRQQKESASLRSTLLFNIEELGPKNYGGRTRAILLDKDDPLNMFAGSVSGGIFHSTNGGTNWSPVNDSMSTLSISYFSQDYFNRDVIYAATGEYVGNSQGIPGNGVYRSNDRGLAFYSLPATSGSEFDVVHRIEASPVQEGRVYMSSIYYGLYRSDNFGDSVYKVFDYGAIRDMEITPSGGLWIGVEGTGVFYSPSGDSGTFVKVLNGLPAIDFYRIELAMAPSDTNVIYAAFENKTHNGMQGIYRTSNFGGTWQKVSNPSIDFDYYMTQTWYSMTMAVKPDDPNFVVFGVGDLVYSTDGGTVWKICLNLHVDHHALVFNPTNPTELFLGEDGGLYKLKTSQMSYTNKNISSGYSTIQYYAGCFFPSGKNAYAGSQDNGTHNCVAGNGNFVSIFGGDGAYCAVNQQYPNVSYVSYQNGTIHRAEDATLQNPSFSNIMNELDANKDNEVDEGAWFINPFEINLVNGDYLGFVTAKRLWHTLDGGYSWQPAMNPINAQSPYAIGISREFSPTVYVGGVSAIFYRIDDAYNSFPGNEKNLSQTLPDQIKNDFTSNITVHPFDNSICYVAFSNYSLQPRLWKVTNAKTSTPVWTSISGDLPAGLTLNYIDVDPARPDDFFVAGTDYGLYVTEDGGNHWELITSIPNVVCYQAKIRPSDRRLFVFTHGRGIWTATLDSLNVGIPATDKKETYAEIFPNPGSGELNIKTSEESGTLSLRNMNNTLVFQTSINSKNEKLYLNHLPTGIYVMEIQFEDKTIIKKFVKTD